MSMTENWESLLLPGLVSLSEDFMNKTDSRISLYFLCLMLKKQKKSFDNKSMACTGEVMRNSLPPILAIYFKVTRRQMKASDIK